MKIDEAIKVLKDHNAWRRDVTSEMVSPKLIGEAIDAAIDAAIAALAAQQPSAPEFILNEIRRQVESAKNPVGAALHSGKVMLDISHVERLLQSKTSAQDSKDAERYRWLRNEHNRFDPVARCRWKFMSNRSSGSWVNLMNGDDLDTHVDAAIAAMAQQENK